MDYTKFKWNLLCILKNSYQNIYTCSKFKHNMLEQNAMRTWKTELQSRQSGELSVVTSAAPVPYLQGPLFKKHIKPRGPQDVFCKNCHISELIQILLKKIKLPSLNIIWKPNFSLEDTSSRFQFKTKLTKALYC